MQNNVFEGRSNITTQNLSNMNEILCEVHFKLMKFNITQLCSRVNR